MRTLRSAFKETLREYIRAAGWRVFTSADPPLPDHHSSLRLSDRASDARACNASAINALTAGRSRSSALVIRDVPHHVSCALQQAFGIRQRVALEEIQVDPVRIDPDRVDHVRGVLVGTKPEHHAALLVVDQLDRAGKSRPQFRPARRFVSFAIAGDCFAMISDRALAAPHTSGGRRFPNPVACSKACAIFSTFRSSR